MNVIKIMCVCEKLQAPNCLQPRLKDSPSPSLSSFYFLFPSSILFLADTAQLQPRLALMELLDLGLLRKPSMYLVHARIIKSCSKIALSCSKPDFPEFQSFPLIPVVHLEKAGGGGGKNERKKERKKEREKKKVSSFRLQPPRQTRLSF